MPKKVAIIGAGPSGLVTAKTLLHAHPGRFAPVIFDSRRSVGGLWAVAGQDGSFIDRDMRTNLSRFTVCFSDFSWDLHVGEEEDDDGLMFPRAAKVNEYLDKYAARYIPDSALRLGCRVLHTERKSAGWTVQWETQGETKEEQFDYLVVASGYFGSPHIPSIPGLDSFPPERVVHSSSLASPTTKLPTNGKILVVGGSMSGAEAASFLALSAPKTQVLHLTTRPFWAVPTYLPSASTGSFLPLDLVMYDLARRPPGDIQYSLAPTVSVDRAALVHGYFAGILGTDQSDVARFDADQKVAPWVAVSDHYAGFVRAGDITTRLGRVEAAHWQTGSDYGSVQVEDQGIIEDVAGIVLATGFTPYNALSFLPDDVLATLEYAPDNAVFPLLLDDKATFHPAVPDLGFVGMYRGPYWGVMEMQARSLAQKWGDNHTQTPNTPLQIQNPRLTLSNATRAQFPMGDYVGLIETFARELGIARTLEETSRTGPAVPVRYAVQTDNNKDEIVATQSALLNLLQRPSGQAHAIFRALHGSWRVERQADGKSTIGVATFRPRVSSSSSSPSSSAADIEYLYSENDSSTTAIFSIAENFIHINKQPGLLSRHIEFVAIDQDQGDAASYQYRHSARGVFSDKSQEMHACEYVFHVKGVQIVSWQESMVLPSGGKQTKTYTR